MVDFDVSPRTVQWLTSIFMLTMAAVIPVTGWFLQRVTTRSAYTVAMVTFLTGTTLAALAPTFEVLLVARSIQAAGTAVMMPLLMTTLMNVVPEEDRGRVMGNIMLAISVAPAFGPVLSGLILNVGSWRLIFAFVLPVAILITVSGLRHLKNVGEIVAGPVSWLSVALAGVGFATLVYGISEVGKRNGGELTTIISVGTVLVAAFVAYQLRLQKSGSPLLDLRTLKSRTFTVTLLLMSAAFGAFLGTMILFPLYLQDLRDLSAMQTGLLVMPGGIAMGLLGPRVGHLYDRFGSRPLVIPGSIVMVGALAALSRVGEGTPFWLILAGHVVLMVSLASIFTPVFTLGLGALPQELYSHGSSILSTLQQVAGAAGTAVLVVVFENRKSAMLQSGAAPDAAFVNGFQWAFVVGAILGVVVIALSLFLPNKVDQPAPVH
jgi:DHA2 family lincomycin resistance protein-like MFS transporter